MAKTFSWGDILLSTHGPFDLAYTGVFGERIGRVRVRSGANHESEREGEKKSMHPFATCVVCSCFATHCFEQSVIPFALSATPAPPSPVIESRDSIPQRAHCPHEWSKMRKGCPHIPSCVCYQKAPHNSGAVSRASGPNPRHRPSSCCYPCSQHSRMNPGTRTADIVIASQ